MPMFRFVTAVSLVALVGCGGHQGSAGSATPSPDSITTLKVDNQRFQDMTIYVVEGALRQRLGLASGNSVSSFTIPRRFTTGPVLVRFLADPVGGRALPISEDITVEPGDEITMRIPP